MSQYDISEADYQQVVEDQGITVKFTEQSFDVYQLDQDDIYIGISEGNGIIASHNRENLLQAIHQYTNVISEKRKQVSKKYLKSIVFFHFAILSRQFHRFIILSELTDASFETNSVYLLSNYPQIDYRISRKKRFQMSYNKIQYTSNY